MATFNSIINIKHDDYMTPLYAWDHIKSFIPKDKTIWEPFYGDGKSGQYLRQLGFDVIHEPIDFFENNLGDIIVSNPPFSDIKEILKRLMVLDKPFILILPVSKLNTHYMQVWKDKLQIMIPPSRIHFDKKIAGQTPTNYRNSCSFDCFYYCYKMNLPKDLMWLCA